MTRTHPRTWAADGLLALALVGIGVAGTRGESLYHSVGVRITASGYALVIVAAAVLSLRRRWPLIVLGIVTLATSTYLYLGYPYGPILLSLLVAVYTVGRHLPARTAAIASGLAIALLAVHVLAGYGIKPGVFGIVPVSAWVVVPVAVGVTLRQHAEAVQRSRVEWARRHADDERLRVAREVHDVVGHGLSSIAMQAEIALHLLERQPEHAAVALAAISATSREALDELRVTLAAIGGPDGESRAPLPGLVRLDALVARMSDSGVTVTVAVTGERRALPGPADLTAYRVIQESLTNVLRHAGPATVRIGLRFDPAEVGVDVQDDGRAPLQYREGQGITGMRQRVEALGGTFQAGPGPDGGFHVSARIPIR